MRKLIFPGIIIISMVAVRLQGQDKLVKSVIGSGGTTSSNSSVTAKMTVGQSVIGIVQNEESKARIGFWNTLAEFVTAVEEIDPQFPGGFILEQNFPNPFYQETVIEFEIPKRTHVRINLFDDRGQLLSILANEELSEGRYRIRMDRKSLAPGLYFYRMEAEEYRAVRKCVVL